MKHRVWIFLVLVITCMTAAVLADGFSSDSGAVEEAALSVLKLTVYNQSGKAIATGSGFIMFDNMTLVTNYHVIEGASAITAESDEGYSYDLRSVLIGSEQQDIAILRMKTPTVMQPLPYNTDPLHRAQKVIAIGSPKGIKNTVSVGIISNTVYSDMYFQHTAATSPGSSGGALFNDNGEVVGITSALRNDGNDIYLAIPIGRVVALYEAWDRTTAVAIADYERANADGQSISAIAMQTDWLAESTDYISLWTQNDEKYLEDVGTSFDLRQLGSDEYVSPCYYLQNDSTQRHEVVCYWLIDGETIEFEDGVLDSGDYMIYSLNRETASEYGVGSHCAEIYVNGQKVREFSWTITAGSAAPSETGVIYDENLTGWLRDATIDVALWTQNAERYIEQVDDEYGLEGLGSGEYVAPRLRVTNRSNSAQKIVIRWVIDGCGLTWPEQTLEAGGTFSTSLDGTDTDYFTPGTHKADFYVNDTHVASYHWILTRNGSGVNDWLQTASVSVSLWSQDDDNYYMEMGDSYAPSELPSGQYVAPLLNVTNNSSVRQTASVYWVIDGEKITFYDREIEPGEQLGWTLIQETAHDYEAAGTHTMEVYVNERLMTTYTWTVTRPVATPTPEPDWLQTAKIEMSLWSQDDERYIEDAGDSYTPSELESGVYVAPRLFVTNNSSTSHSANVYWMVDGNKVSFSDATLESDERKSWSLAQSTARKYETAGTHTVKVYINDRLVKTYTWTVKAPRATATPEPDWLETANIEMSLWTRDAESFIQDVGASYTPSAVASGEYVTLRLMIKNNTSANQDASVYLMIDGDRISYSDWTMKPSERHSWYMTRDAISQYETAGTHTAKAYVNDRLVKTYTWTVNAPRATATPEPDWLETANIRISLWRRDDDNYYEDVGDSYTPSELASGEFVAPRLIIENNTSVNQSASVYWMVDGDRVTFDDRELKPNTRHGWSLAQGTAREFETAGTHTVKVYINDRLVKTYTWTVKAPRATATPEPDWLQTAKIEMSLWSQDGERHIKDLGNSYTPSTLGSGVYAAPRLYVTNNSSINQNASIYWMIDGNKISFSDETLEPDERRGWTLSQSTARKYETAGTHTAKVYINDRLMKTYTWTVKSSSSSSRAQVVPVTNGTILIKPSYKDQCRFTVTADSSTNFYVYLKYQGIPANTRLRRETSGLSTPESDVAFYVRAGQEVSIRVPIGEYKLYYACGKDFYGTKLLFGDDTRCYRYKNILSFYSDDEYYYGNTLTLYASTGNAESIGRADFPTR